MDYLIYIYGYSFYVLKIVYFEFDFIIGLVMNFSRDIECEIEICLKLRWSNEEWVGGNFFDLNLWNFLFKDMVVVLRGGYVVFRFYLDNLGMISRFFFDYMILIEIV